MRPDGRASGTPGRPGRAPRDARPRRTGARPRDPAHRRPRRSARDRRRDGRGRQRGDRRDHAIVVESAIFDPVSIRRTGVRYALRSEASFRFEKGQEPRLARLGADRVARADRGLGGGRVAPGGSTPHPAEPQRHAWPSGRRACSGSSGSTFEPARAGGAAGAVGIASSRPPPARHPGRRGRRSRSRSRAPRRPSWRSCRRGAATSRSRPTSPRRSPASSATTRCRPARPTRPMPHFRPDPLESRDESARRPRRCRPHRGGDAGPRAGRAGRAPRLARRRGGWRAGRRCRGRVVIRARNPLSERHAVLRSGLVGSLLDVLALNERHGHGNAAIFEIGKGYARGSDGSGGVVAPRVPPGGRCHRTDVEPPGPILGRGGREGDRGACCWGDRRRRAGLPGPRRRRTPPSGPSSVR